MSLVGCPRLSSAEWPTGTSDLWYLREARTGCRRMGGKLWLTDGRGGGTVTIMWTDGPRNDDTPLMCDTDGRICLAYGAPEGSNQMQNPRQECDTGLISLCRVVARWICTVTFACVQPFRATVQISVSSSSPWNENRQPEGLSCLLCFAFISIYQQRVITNIFLFRMNLTRVHFGRVICWQILFSYMLMRSSLLLNVRLCRQFVVVILVWRLLRHKEELTSWKYFKFQLNFFVWPCDFVPC